MRILNIKIISITLIATLLFQSASWASAPDQEKQKIQVPSAFNQITNNTNWQYDEQVRIEVALILAIKPNTPFHVINDNIDRMYEGTRKKRIVDVIPPAGVEAKNKDRQVKFLYGHRKGEILDLSITGQDKKGEQKQEKFSERTEEYDDQGNLTKIYDKETGRIWEKYERDEGGQINEVLLYNPRSGKRLELMRDPMFGKNEEDEHDRSVRWIIFYENENREEDWIGGVTTNENEERIELKDITIRFDEERGEGNGKTIMRWLALTAHRKQKELKIAEIHNPATTGIAKELYLQETLRVTQEKNIIPFSGNKELDAILLEQEYYFMTLMEDGLAPERRHVTIGKGTGNILLGDEWPAEYKAFVDKDRLIVKDKKGKNVRLTYSKLLYLIGKPDKNNIIRLQQEEEIERENKKETDIPGRKTEYGDQGRVRKIYDDKTGITWEEYTYDEGGITKTITLYNPALGGTIKIEKDPLYSDKKDTNEGPSRWYIKNTEKGKEDEKIGSIAIMRSNEKIMILNIRIYEEEDKGKGLGKTILRWIAVSAHRENKILKVSTTTSPIAAAISLTLFDFSTLVLKQEKERIEAKNEKELLNILVEQEYLLMEEERRLIAELEIKKGTREIVKGNKWPEKYTAAIKENKVIVKNKDGVSFPIVYKEPFDWEGRSDAVSIVRMQDEEEQQRKEQALDDKMTEIMAKEGPETKRWGPYMVDGVKCYAESIIKPSEIRETLDKWFRGAEERYFGRHQWDNAISVAKEKGSPAFLTKVENEKGEVLGISYCHKGIFPFEDGDVMTYLGDFSEVASGYRGKSIGEILLAKKLERIVCAHPEESRQEEAYIVHPAEDEEYADEGKRAADFWEKRGFENVYFSWYEGLPKEEKSRNRYMALPIHDAQRLVDKVKRNELTERPKIPRQMSLFPEKAVQMSLFPKENAVSEREIKRLRTRTKWQKRQRKKKKKQINPQSHLFGEEGLIREGSSWIAYEKAKSIAKLHEKVAQETEKDLKMNEKRKKRLKKFFLRYIKAADKAASFREEDFSLFAETLKPENIADMFYLSEIYKFNVLDLIEKGKAVWNKKKSKKEDKYEFELDGEYCTRIKGYDSKGQKTELGDAVCWTEDLVVISLHERGESGGQNRGNFLMKTYMINRWARGDKALNSFIGYNENAQDAYALKKTHETMGAEIDPKGEKALYNLQGGIDAGIMTKAEAERIKGLNKYVWRVWSQRKIDRYFSAIKNVDQATLFEANKAFTEETKEIGKEDLRKIQPEKVTKFIEEYLKKEKVEQKEAKMTIKKTGEIFKEIVRKREAHQEEKVAVPVDVAVDLSLFPVDEEELKGEIETWAYLILLCRDLNNVNFIFEKGSRLTRGRKMTESLEKEKLLAPGEAKVVRDIKDAIGEKAIFFDIDPLKIDAILNERINPEIMGSKTGRIEVPIVSVDLLKWIREEKNRGENIGVAENQYPVAMEGSLPGVNKTPTLKNFEAALALGLMKAALVMIPSDENAEERRDISTKIKKLYEILRPGFEVGEEAVRNMISSDLVRRLNRAIEFALPPITRTNIEELRNLREGLNLALQAA